MDNEDLANEKIYEEEYLGKKKKLDPSKNPNYRRFTGLSNLIKTLKHDHDIIKNGRIDTPNQDSHVKLFIREQRINAFGIILGYYEEEIQSVKKKLELGITNV